MARIPIPLSTARYTGARPVEISPSIAVIAFTNVFNRIDDAAIDVPAVA